MLQRWSLFVGLAVLGLMALAAEPAAAQTGVLRVTVVVPADAEFWINGIKTSQTGRERQFESGSLRSGRIYYYDFRARWKKAGKVVEKTRKISFTPGDRLTIDFTRDAGGPNLKKSLYARLGGAKAIAAVVDDFVARAAADPKVNFTRKGTSREWKATPENIAKLKTGLVQMIGAATGGPKKYTGKSMKEAHKGMQIGDKEFAAAVDNLKASLDKLKVPVKEQDELLAIVAGTGKDIVEPVAPKPKTLFARLGGKAAVKAVVDDFVTRAAANPKVNFTRKGTPREWKATPENVGMLKKHLEQIIAAVTGGSQKYSGKSMKEAHKGMQITAAEFDAAAADLKASLDKLKVPAKEQAELLALVADTKKDIVEPVAPKPKTLYERLGGEAAIKAVVDDFAGRAAANPKVNLTRKGTAKEWKATPENVAKVKAGLVQFVGAATGGPQKYTGKSMKDLHKGMQITAAEFDAAAADLKASLDKLKVPAKEQAELLAILGGTRKDIVEPVAPKPKTLFERLGGEAAIKAVVDDFSGRAAANPKVNLTRKGTGKEWKATPENVAKLKAGLVQFIGAATGGPQKYTGKSMKDAHKGLKITAAEFDAAAADLKASLDKLKVPAKEQAELLALVAGTKKDIVEPVAPKLNGQ